MIRHPLGLEWGTVGGEEGWLDPRVKDVKKLLPKNMGAKEERKIWKQLSQQQAKERHSKRWFVGDKTVKGTKPDLTPVDKKKIKVIDAYNQEKNKMEDKPMVEKSTKEIPKFDALGGRSAQKIKVLGISV